METNALNLTAVWKICFLHSRKIAFSIRVLFWREFHPPSSSLFL